DEREVPVQDILTSTLCELRSAFARLSDKALFPSFKADQWAASVTLTPKVDTELDLRYGWTRKGTSKTSHLIVSWTLGSPGAQADLKTHRDGSVSYAFHTAQLLQSSAEIDLECSERMRIAHSLAQYHGIYEWWARLIPREGSGLASVTRPD